MQFSENWLRSLIDPPLNSDQLAHLLTMAGLEVESLDGVAAAFDGVVVACVLSAEKHPGADRLKLCQVDVGQAEALQIVCGAPNVAAGLKVPCAMVGATLPGLQIKAAKVRGIDSFGMLCAARELGLADDQGGLLVLPQDAPTGADIRNYLGLDDKVLTLKLTPNRADCLSLLGIAREVGALTGVAPALPGVDAVVPEIEAQRAIVLDAPQACPRYCGRVVSGIDPAAPTPLWMKQRLERCGVRSISAVVDITNYVMLERGQPLHAFDNSALTGAVHVRFPRPGETLLLLNEQTVEPAADTLLICDETHALALAGVMGGEESGVGDATTEIFLESAFFAPEAVAGRARALGFSSDASHRFERGVDFTATREAMERATRLVLDICGGQAGPITEGLATLPERSPIRLRAARARRVLGLALESGQIETLLRALAVNFNGDGEEFLVTPPSYRFDLSIEEDLIEELARLHGYDNIPVRLPLGTLAMLPNPEEVRNISSLRRLLVGRDYQEVINFSFVDASWEANFCDNATPVTLSNPIASQMSVMRSSLIGGLVANFQTNLRRRLNRVRVFEFGRCFMRAAHGDTAAQVEGFHQPAHLAGLSGGPVMPEQWGAPSRNADFFDAKADVEALFAPQQPQFQKIQHPALHPGRAAAVVVNGRGVGIIGELHPQWVQKYELDFAPVLFEVDFDALVTGDLPVYREVSNFPAVVRDLALLVPRETTIQSILDGLRADAPGIVRSIELFDLYQGKGVEPGRKSLAFRIVMQDTEKTLADSDVESAVAMIVKKAAQNFDARLRA